MTMTSATAMYHDMNESDKFNSEKKQSRQDFIYIKKLAKQTYTIISQNSKYFREGESISGSEGDFLAASIAPFCIFICDGYVSNCFGRTVGEINSLGAFLSLQHSCNCTHPCLDP